MKNTMTRIQRMAATAMPIVVAVVMAGCSGGQSGDDVVQDVADTGSDVVADVPGDTTVADARDVAGADATDALTDDVVDAVSDTIPDAADVEDADVPPPPLWEGIAPTGLNTVRAMLGVSTHMEQSVGEDTYRDFEFEKYAELGTPTIREDFHWSRIEATDDAWNMDAVNGQVNQAVANGVTVLPMLGYEVDWAMTDTSDFSTIDFAEFGEFAGHVAREYCDHIKDYEVWNEENIPRFWEPTPDPEAYGNLLKAAHDGIKAACPDARVAFGGMSSYDAETDLTDRFAFLERVAQAHPDICDYFEIVGYHPYTFMQYDSPERDVNIDGTLIFQGQTWQTDIVRGYLASMGCPDKALMITEQGWPTYDLSEDQVGRFAPRSLVLASRDGVEKYIWYTFWDGYPTTEGIRPHESYFGLFGWTGDDGTVRRAKPAWNSIKALADTLGDMTFARDISDALGLPLDVYALAFMNPAGDITVAAWDGRDFPDQSYGTDAPGGPDTACEMTMPLPEGFTGVTVFDIFGAQVAGDGETAGYTLADSVLSITLTPSIQYIQLAATDVLSAPQP